MILYPHHRILSQPMNLMDQKPQPQFHHHKLVCICLIILNYFDISILSILYIFWSIHLNQIDQNHRILIRLMVHISHSHKMEHKPKEPLNTPKEYQSNNCCNHLLPYYLHHRTLLSTFISLPIFHLRKFKYSLIFAHFDLHNSNQEN